MARFMAQELTKDEMCKILTTRWHEANNAAYDCGKTHGEYSEHPGDYAYHVGKRDAVEILARDMDVPMGVGVLELNK